MTTKTTTEFIKIKKNCRLEVNRANDRLWLKCTRYFNGGMSDRIEEYFYQEGTNFRLTGRIVHGNVSTLAILRREEKYPTNCKIKMG